MKNIMLLSAAVFIFALVFGVSPVLADDPPVCPDPPCVYVDPGRDPAGNEDGSSGSPYNDPREGNAYALSQQDGAWVFTRNSDGTWAKVFIDGAFSGGTGLPLARSTLYMLVAAAALLLILTGWVLQRRSRTLLR